MTIDNFQFVHRLPYVYQALAVNKRIICFVYTVTPELPWRRRNETSYWPRYTVYGIRTSTNHLQWLDDVLDSFAVTIPMSSITWTWQACSWSQSVTSISLKSISLQFRKIPTYVVISIIPLELKNHPRPIRPLSGGVA